MKHCSRCGGLLERGVPPGDDRERFICQACGKIQYQNPRMVVGCIPRWQDRILLCRRAIEPRYGTWTLPAGFLENEESVEEGARRELMEEARATALDLQPYGLYNIPRVSQVYLFFIGALASGEFAAGEETLETRLFGEDEIPWEELAFPVVETTLRRYFRDAREKVFPFHIEDITVRMKGAGRKSREVG